LTRLTRLTQLTELTWPTQPVEPTQPPRQYEVSHDFNFPPPPVRDGQHELTLAAQRQAAGRLRRGLAVEDHVQSGERVQRLAALFTQRVANRFNAAADALTPPAGSPDATPSPLASIGNPSIGNQQRQQPFRSGWNALPLLRAR
jgi:hypothetical protein